jgi:hypothetical protein
MQSPWTSKVFPKELAPVKGLLLYILNEIAASLQTRLHVVFKVCSALEILDCSMAQV